MFDVDMLTRVHNALVIESEQLNLELCQLLILCEVFRLNTTFQQLFKHVQVHLHIICDDRLHASHLADVRVCIMVT